MNKDKVALKECRISLSKYSLNHCEIFNPEGYTILCPREEASNGLGYFFKIFKIVLNTGQQSRFIYNLYQFVSNIIEYFEIS